jgi:trans-aconitate 2-methyltransferase
MPWDPQQYLKFERERTQPSIDLAARIDIANPRRIIDLGCGPGNSTAVLHRRWPEAEITGLDSDEEMLRAARRDYPRHYWLQQDAASWESRGGYDIVFSNAMLQWLPDHAAVINRWFQTVEPGGALAVQLPVNFRSAIHQHIVEVADEPDWRDQLAPAKRLLFAKDPDDYYNILSPLSNRIDLWSTEYIHILPRHEDIIEWMRGTGMRPYLAALTSEDERKRFEAEVLARVKKSYPPQADGRVLFPFRRLFFIAYRRAEG